MELSMYTAVRIVKIKAWRKLTRISKPVIATRSANENGMITKVGLSAKRLRLFEILQKPFSREMIVNAVKKAIGPPGGSLGLTKAA